MEEPTSGPVNPEGPPDEESAAAEPAAEEPTAAEPAATEPAVAEPAAPTQATPTIASGGGSTSMSGKTILIGIAAIAIIAVAIWFFAFRSSGIGDKFVGTWVPVDTSTGGGGIIVTESGDTFKLDMINETGGIDITLTGKL